MLADAAEAGSHDGKSNEGIPSDNPAFCTLAAHGICNTRESKTLISVTYTLGGFLGEILRILDCRFSANCALCLKFGHFLS